MKIGSSRQRGATAVTLAASLMLLMGMAALAIDIGAGKNERRLDQNTADASVLAGGVELIVSGGVQLAVDAIKQYVDTNLGRAVAAADWAACTDPDSLAIPSNTIPGVVGGSPCISFGSSTQGVAYAHVRVRVPNQDVPTSFGRILGVVNLETAAAAEAQLLSTTASGAFPSAVFSGAGGGDSFCIKTGAGAANSTSCGSPSSGDFGNFVPYFYTEVAPGNPSTICASGNQPAPLSRIIADGLDHFLGTTPAVPGNRRNGDNCPSFPGPAFPNRLDSGSGYSNDDVTRGLISGGAYDGGFTGRLTRKLWSSGTYGTAALFGFQIDNRPLWTYIDPAVVAGPGVPASCQAAATGPARNDGPADEAAYVAAQAAMASCLADPNAPDGLLGADTDGVAGPDIYLTPRLVIVPKYHQAGPIGNNACCYDVMDFLPVFIDGLWTDNGPQWTCNGGMVNDPTNDYCKHEPGRTGTISVGAVGNRRVDSAGATVLSCEVLPGPEPALERCKKVSSVGGNTITIFLNLVLTK